MKRLWMVAAVAVAVTFTTAVRFANQEQSTGEIFARSGTVGGSAQTGASSDESFVAFNRGIP